MDNQKSANLTRSSAGLLTVQHQQAFLAAAIAVSEDAIFSTNVFGEIISWNPACKRMFGYTEIEAAGKHISYIIPPDFLQGAELMLVAIAEGEPIDRFETFLLPKNGTPAHVVLSIQPVKDDTGAAIGATMIAYNSSHKNQADEKLGRLAAIIDSSDDAIISKTLAGIITSWNPAAERLFGYTENEAIGKHISLIIPVDRLNEEDIIIAHIAQGLKMDHFETMRITKGGTLVAISVTISPIVNSDGKIIGASKIARDISEHNKAVEKQSVLAAIVNSSDDAILSKTLDGNITSWNKAAEKMFGYTEEDAIGKHISLIIPPERLDEEYYIIGEVKSGRKVNHFHTVRLAKDGRQIPISLSVSPIVNDKGEVIGASKIARDISEQLAAQEQNARLYEQVKVLSAKKDEFIGLASHELKTPLTSILAYLQILMKSVTDTQGQVFLLKANLQVKKVIALIDDLLNVSQIETGKLKLNPERFDIRQLITDNIEMVSHTNKKFTIVFESAIKELFITGDPHRIEQVIINLLTNAIRYAPASPKIVIHLIQQDQQIKVGVQDFGNGIAADKLVEIFSKFYRVDDQHSNISGLGIGLFLSQDIINRHNGKIWAESVVGEGSTFWFEIPI